MIILLEGIHIKKQEFFKALNIDEVADYILSIERKYIGDKTLGDLSDEIDYSDCKEVIYVDDVEFDVLTLAELLKKHEIMFKIEMVTNYE